jgi:LmbE family N-acetylglucosaminyl deacetylase
VAITADREVPTSVLAVGAHPDDVEFGCGATLAKWAAHGCVVHHLVCTDGSKGTWDPHVDPAALALLRRDEQREAARRLAPTTAGEVIFLEHIDGELSADRNAVSQVAETMRRLRPEVVLGHDPWKRYRLHPDHRNAGLLVCDAIVAARDPHFFPEHRLPPHRPDSLLLWEADTVHHIERVEGYVAAKLHALEAHASQFESTMHAVDEEQLIAFRKRIEHRLRALGDQFSAGGPVEAFARLDDL